MNDANVHDHLSEADTAHATTSATVYSLLADVKSRLVESNALIEAGTSETRGLTSKLYVGEIRSALSHIDGHPQRIPPFAWDWCSLLHAKDFVSSQGLS